MTLPISLIVTPARYSSIELLSDSAVFISRDEIVPAIYPGEPFGVRWHYLSVIGNTQPGAAVSALVLSQNKLAQLANSSVAYVMGGVSDEIQGISTKEASVYRIGNNNSLILQTGISGLAASMDETSTNYAVIAEDLARGFEWNIVSNSNDYRHAAFAWKTAYTIAAIFTDISQWVTLTGTATLLEASSSAGPWSNRGTIPVQLSPGRTTPLTFPQLQQNWGWLAPGVWVIYGDLYRSFFYTVQFNLTDDFGNTYAFRTDIATIAVYVPDKKYALAAGAEAAIALAAILYLISWLVTPAPAGAAQAAATGLGSAALDPPRPSKNFRKAIRLPRRVVCSMGPQLQPLTPVITEAAFFARLDNTLYKIESRYLGAVAAKDTQAAKLQANSYKEVTRLMNLAAGRLSVAVDAAQPWLRSQNVVNETLVRKALITWNGKGMNRKKRSARRTLDAKTTRLLNELLQSPQLVAAAIEGIEANLGKLRNALLAAAADTGRDRLKFERKARQRYT